MAYSDDAIEVREDKEEASWAYHGATSSAIELLGKMRSVY